MARRSKNKRWSDLSSEQRVAVSVVGVVQVGLLIAALRDLWRRPADQVNGSKLLWAPVCFINFFGPLAYFRFGRKR
ncbi:MAG TPA: PLD nuclease N-terminal domain-containing protein [Solirubrobacteraceae bacterium]|nr:PLD nuclease N-terminal domain-containing protein [Solirubrobacteraceae bacterium]